MHMALLRSLDASIHHRTQLLSLETTCSHSLMDITLSILISKILLPSTLLFNIFIRFISPGLLIFQKFSFPPTYDPIFDIYFRYYYSFIYITLYSYTEREIMQRASFPFFPAHPELAVTTFMHNWWKQRDLLSIDVFFLPHIYDEPIEQMLLFFSFWFNSRLYDLIDSSFCHFFRWL